MEYKTIGYTQVIADLLHYGIFKLLETAKENCDYLIVGVLSDNEANKQRFTIQTLKERLSIIENLKCVDEVVIQDCIEPISNIIKIKDRYPDSKIRLFHGDDWNYIYGSDYVESIGGEVITLPYYKRLDNKKLKIVYENAESVILSTKGETLYNLKNKLKKSYIPISMIFNSDDFRKNPQSILNLIMDRFKNKDIVIRSSSSKEDGYEESNAGHYISITNISSSNIKDISNSINNVIDSYDNHNEQVLIQEQIKNIKISGVLFTRNLENNSPYYVINYDATERTDSVTSGNVNTHIKILKNISYKELPKLWSNLIKSIREIEDIIPSIPLDIEFIITKNNKVYIIQVRPLATNKIMYTNIDEYIYNTIDGINYDGGIYSDMAFWNPSEIIGTNPNNLSYSLYRYIITNNSWNEGILNLGYTNVGGDLMVKFCGKPYINIDKTIKSLTFEDIPKEINNKLSTYYKKKLRNHPELHDKVEFDVIYNCYYPNIEQDIKELDDVLNDDEKLIFINSLKTNTNKIITSSKKEFDKINYNIKIMDIRCKGCINNYKNNVSSIIHHIKLLLDDCINLGTKNFSKVARMAFISNIWLKSLVKNKTLSIEEYNNYLNGMNAIQKCNHLREGTYDITSEIKKSKKEIKNNGKRFVPAQIKEKDDFFTESIEMRERCKFYFTKNISEVLNLIEKLGRLLGYTNKEISYLDIDLILSCEDRDIYDIKDLFDIVINKRKEQSKINQFIELPSIIYNKKDFKFINSYISKPNFVTNKKITSTITFDTDDIDNKIVCIERADPSYDWIFSKNIKGLITCYGGVASHMCIRCLESKLPAAIGCGKEFYNQLKNVKTVTLDCEKNEIVINSKRE